MMTSEASLLTRRRSSALSASPTRSLAASWRLASSAASTLLASTRFSDRGRRELHLRSSRLHRIRMPRGSLRSLDGIRRSLRSRSSARSLMRLRDSAHRELQSAVHPESALALPDTHSSARLIIATATSPNHALQRTAPGVTACAPARRPAPAAFPHRLRRPPQSLSLGSFGVLDTLLETTASSSSRSDAHRRWLCSHRDLRSTSRSHLRARHSRTLLTAPCSTAAASSPSCAHSLDSVAPSLRS